MNDGLGGRGVEGYSVVCAFWSACSVKGKRVAWDEHVSKQTEREQAMQLGRWLTSEVKRDFGVLLGGVMIGRYSSARPQQGGEGEGEQGV